MWMSQTRPVQVLFVMIVLVMLIWSSVVQTSHGNDTDIYDDEEDEDDPKVLFAKSKSEAIKVEVVLILADSSNISLGLSKSLSRALKSVPLSFIDNSSSHKTQRVLWRVKNFVVSTQNNTENFVEADSQRNKSERRTKSKNDTVRRGDVVFDDTEPQRNALFHPNLIPSLCNFLGRTKAVALLNLIEDAGSERLVSLISNSASIPLIGSFQSGEPVLQIQQKSDEDLHVTLSTSVRQYARALGHLLTFCHWHTFTVIFDDVPFTLSSQIAWKMELRNMKIVSSHTSSSLFGTNSNFTKDPTLTDEFESYEEFDYEFYNSNGADNDSEPSLNPTFVALKSKTLETTVLRTLNQISKSTQGIIVLLCSKNSLGQVFLAAQKLRMLNGDYIFIIVDQYHQFEDIPEWIPSGVLALRSPLKAQAGKQSLKRVGRLLASALHSSLSVLSREDRKERSDNHSKNISRVNMFATRSSDDDDAISFEENNLHYDNAQFDLSFMNSKGKRRLRMLNAEKLQTRHDFHLVPDFINNMPNVSCWKSSYIRKIFSETLARELRTQGEALEFLNPSTATADEMTEEKFDILNLVGSGFDRKWKIIGNVSAATAQVHLDTIRWPGGGILSARAKELKSYRIVSIIAPPFVMAIDSFDNKSCEKGLPCLKVQTNNQDELALIFADFESGMGSRTDYKVLCCDGLTIDLLSSISRELNFKINLFLVPDGFFGSLSASGDWNGLMSAIVSGSAHMSFAPFSVTSARSTAIDFSTPFFFSGVGFLGTAKTQDVPLLAFLAPFSFELWAAIFITLNITALAVALFEWLSPFGLNPWGRQRTKNFSISSALWVVWGRLFSHLVAFKAPKSWPNKFLINVWGGFSVIFVASYTANIAALFAGMFFERGVDVHDRSLLSQKVAAVKHSATHFYIKKENQLLWEHIQKFPVFSFQQGIELLKNGSLDLLAGDGPLLDYYRGADPYCNLIDVSDHDKIGEDTYAVAMAKGFPLKESISTLIAKYLGNGYLDHLQGKWYGQLVCFRKRRAEITGARALGVDSVAGMIIMLGLGMVIGLLILFMELVVYKFALPYFRRQPKGTLWRSPNIMFFSQKLYRFINCVELVSPHHAAKELVNTLRHGQITSLFQKSVKRKEHEQRRRRKSKAQFFEMIQEVRRVQKQERQKRTQVRQDASPEVFSIQARLQSNRNMPKLIRVLGVEEDISNRVFETTTKTGEPFEGPVLVIEEPDPEEEGIMETGFVEGQNPPIRKILKKRPDTIQLKSVDFNLKPGENTREAYDEQNNQLLERLEDMHTDNLFQSSPSSVENIHLSCLSKNQILMLWKSREIKLREELNKALEEKNELAAKLQSLAAGKPP